MDLLTLAKNFDTSLNNVLNNKPDIFLLINSSFLAQFRDLNIKTIVNFTIMTSNTSSKSDINKPQYNAIVTKPSYMI